MKYRELDTEQAACLFWDGLRRVADAAAVVRDEELYRAIRKVGMAALSQNIPLPGTGEFVRCPVCRANPGQQCINMPRHPLTDHMHPERHDRGQRLREEIGHRQQLA